MDRNEDEHREGDDERAEGDGGRAPKPALTEEEEQFRASLAIGTKLEVLDPYGKWYGSTCKKLDPEFRRIFIGYNGWPSQWDEWISLDSERIRKMKPRMLGTGNGKVTKLSVKRDPDGTINANKSTGQITEGSYIRVHFNFTNLVHPKASVRIGDLVKYKKKSLAGESFATDIEVTKRAPMIGKIQSLYADGGTIVWNEDDQEAADEPIFGDKDAPADDVDNEDEVLRFFISDATLTNPDMPILQGDGVQFVRDFNPETNDVYAINITLIDPVLIEREFGKFVKVKAQRGKKGYVKVVPEGVKKAELKNINTGCVIGGKDVTLNNGARISYNIIDGAVTRIMKLHTDKNETPQQKALNSQYKNRYNAFIRTTTARRGFINQRRNDPDELKQAIQIYNEFMKKLTDLKNHNLRNDEMIALKKEALAPVLFYLARDYIVACIKRGFMVPENKYDPRLAPFVDKSRRSGNFDQEELETLRNMIYDDITKPKPAIHEGDVKDESDVKGGAKKVDLRHIRIYWNSRLEIEKGTAVYIYVRSEELGKDEIPFKLESVWRDKNFLVADLWLPRPAKHRINFFTYQFGVESPDMPTVKMVPGNFRFEAHLCCKFHNNLIGVGFLGYSFGSLQAMFNGFTTRMASFHEPLIRSLLKDLEDENIPVCDAVAFAEICLRKPKKDWDSHPISWDDNRGGNNRGGNRGGNRGVNQRGNVASNFGGLLGAVDGISREMQTEFFEYVLNPSTDIDCIKALFVILGLKAKVTVNDFIKLSFEIARLYESLHLHTHFLRSNCNSLQELLINVWRDDKEHKHALKLVPFWNAIDKARMAAGLGKYHRLPKLRVLTDPIFEVNEVIDCQDKLGGWYPANILKVNKTQVYINYVGYSSKWDEWIDRTSVRLARHGSHSSKRHVARKEVAEHDIELVYGNQTNEEFVKMFQDVLRVDMALGPNRHLPLETCITAMIPESSSVAFIELLLEMNEGVEEEEFLSNMLIDRALGRILTSPRNAGDLWHSVLCIYRDRGVMDKPNILKRFEDCLLGYINKPNSSLTDTMKFLPAITLEFPHIWTLPPRAALLRKDVKDTPLRDLINLTFKEGLDIEDAEQVNDIFLRDASACLTKCFDELKSDRGVDGAGILDICSLSPPLADLYSRAGVQALTTFVGEVLGSPMKTIEAFITLKGIDELHPTLLEMLKDKMCEVKWRSVSSSSQAVENLGDCLSACLKNNFKCSVQLCCEVIDKLLAEQIPEERPAGVYDQSFIMWLLGSVQEPDYASLPLMICNLHHKTSIPRERHKNIDTFLNRMPQTLKEVCDQMKDLTVPIEIIRLLADPITRKRFDRLCRHQRRPIKLDEKSYIAALDAYDEVNTCNDLMFVFRSFYVKVRDSEMAEDLKTFVNFVDDTNKNWDERCLGETAALHQWKIGEPYIDQLKALHSLHKNNTFLGVWSKPRESLKLKPKKDVDDDKDSDDEAGIPDFLQLEDSDDDDDDENADGDEQKEETHYSLDSILVKKFDLVMKECAELSGHVIDETLTRGHLESMSYLHGRAEDVVNEELSLFVEICYRYPKKHKHVNVQKMSEAIVGSHKFSEMSGFLRTITEVAQTIKLAVSKKPESVEPEIDQTWTDLLAVLEKDAKESSAILVVNASARISDLKQSLPAEFSDLQAQWITLLAKKPEVLISMATKEYLVDDSQFNGLLEVIQANPLNALEGQKAASLQNVRNTLLRMLDTKMPSMKTVMLVLQQQKIAEKSVSDLNIVCQSLESFDRKYQDVGSIDLVHDKNILNDPDAEFRWTIPAETSSPDPPNTAKQCFRLFVVSSDEELPYGTLSNLRDRLLLSIQPDDKQLLEDVTKFEKTIEKAQQISLARCEYFLEGGRDGLDKDTSFLCKQPLRHWEALLARWQAKLKTWRHRMSNYRSRFTSLNYYPMNEILAMYGILAKEGEHKEDDIDTLHAACQVARRLVTKEDVVQELQENTDEWKAHIGEIPACVGTFLGRIFRKYAPPPDPPNTHLSGVIQGEPNLFLPQSPINCLLKLYAQREVSPVSEQVLLCSPDTTAEETHCLILRCLDSVRDQDEYRDAVYSRLYVLISPENLTYVCQIKLIEQIHTLQSSKEVPYAFAIITSDRHNRVVSRLREFDRDPVRMQAIELFRTYKELFRFKHFSEEEKDFVVPTPMVRVFSSRLPGAGKSFVIKKRAKDYCGGHFVRIPVNGDVNVDAMIKKLEADDLDISDEEERVLHINIASSATEIVNIVMFKLLVLGHISTPFGKRYNTKTADCFLIELPTNISVLSESPDKRERDTVEDKFYFFAQTQGLPREIVSEETNPLDVTDREQYVFKWLRAYKNNLLKGGENDPDFDHTQAEDFDDDDEWKDLLQQYCPQALGSMILTVNFIKYMHGQLEQVDGNIFLKNFNKPREDIHLKHIVVDSLVQSSQDFSCRSYKKKEDNEENKYEFGDETSGTESFEISSRWQDSGIPMFLLNQAHVAKTGGFGDLSILVHDLDKLPRDVHQMLTTDLQFKLIDFQAEERKRKRFLMEKAEVRDEASRQDKLDLLLRVFGNMDDANAGHAEPETNRWLLEQRLTDFQNYALTFDNILKMFAIYFRVKSQIPVVLMGETGCGKTRLVEFLCKVLNVRLFTFDVHGGYTEDMIEEKMTVAIDAAKDNPNDIIWVFFDEVNTCDYLGVFNEILCDRSLNGNPIPGNLMVLAACNPYRKHRVTGKLVYRVHPLPETMKEYVWNFGSLSATDERQYIGAMLSKADEAEYIREMLNERMKEAHIKPEVQKLQKDFIDRIVKSQEFLRIASGGEVSVVSLRDVARCVRLFVWFYGRREGSYQHRFYESMMLALAHCYYYRLDVVQRQEYAAMMDGQQRDDAVGVIGGVMKKLTNKQRRKAGFMAILRKEQQSYIEHMKDKIPDGIALNNMLRENIFMIVVCIMTKTPLVIVGKPGSSKTLAMSIVRDSLATSTKAHGLSKLGFGDISMFQFQCSKLSTAAGIKSRFDAAMKFQNNVNADRVGEEEKGELADDACLHAGVFLDEVGLAEQSPYLPLKVLHQLLEHPQVWFVALSNWQLDSAKMNRMVFHNCPIHTEEDLVETAQAIVESYAQKGAIDQVLSASLPQIASVYHRINDDQPYPNFFGTREFYSIVQFLSRAVQSKYRMDDDLLSKAFLRNFGGLPPDVPKANDDGFMMRSSEFLAKKIKSVVSWTELDCKDRIENMSAIDLVLENIDETRSQAKRKKGVLTKAQTTARNIMVLCDFESTWQLLFDQNVVSHEDAIVLFGSNFVKDKNSSLNIFQNINHIKNCMETGKICVLIDLEELYDSLYDMLNQSWTTIGDQRYCRVALGAESVMCKVHPQFKCIVVVNSKEAHTPENQGGIPTAFLNRFEKQLISRQELITGELATIERKVYAACRRILNTRRGRLGNLETAFCGFNSETIPSLLLSMVAEEKKENGDEFEIDPEAMARRCYEKLLWVCPPEQILAHDTKGPWDKEKYFKQQEHKSLSDLLTYGALNKWNTGNGQRVMVFTHDYLQQEEIVASFEEEAYSPTMVNVSDFETQVEFTRRLFDFFSPENDEFDSLIVQCDLKETGVKHIMHIKYLVEKHQATAVIDATLEEVKLVRQSSFVDAIEEDITAVSTELQKRHSEMSSANSEVDDGKYDAENSPRTPQPEARPPAGYEDDGKFGVGSGDVGGGGAEMKNQPQEAEAKAGGGAEEMKAGGGVGDIDESKYERNLSETGDDDEFKDFPPPGGEGDPGDELPPGPPGSSRKKKARRNMLKHVILLVHTDRGKDSQFPLVYERGWKFVFLDALISAKYLGIPTVETMASRDLRTQIGDDIRGLARRTFKKAVAKLQFTRAVIGIQPIRIFENLMSGDAWDGGAFFEILQAKMSAMLQQIRSENDESVVDLVLNVLFQSQRQQKGHQRQRSGFDPRPHLVGLEEGWLRGSFRGEVVDSTDKLVQNCFGLILAKLYANSHLDLYTEDVAGDYQQRWLAIFDDPKLFSLPQIPSSHQVAIHVEHEMTSKFPFSTYINAWFENQRQTLLELSGVAGNLQLNESHHLKIFDNLVKTQQFKFINYLGRGLDISPVLKSYGHDISFFARFWSHTDSELDNEYANFCATFLLLYAKGLRDKAQLWDIQCALWTLEVPLRHMINIATCFNDAIFTYQEIVARHGEDSLQMVVVHVLHDLVNKLNGPAHGLQKFVNLVVSIHRDVEYLLSFCDSMSDDNPKQELIDLHSKWRDLEYRHAFCREVLLPARVPRRKTTAILQQLERDCSQRHELDCLVSLLNTLGRLFPGNEEQQVIENSRNRQLCSSFVQLHLSKFCFTSSQPPSTTLIRVLCQVIGEPHTRIDIALAETGMHLEGVCSSNCKREILRQIWSIQTDLYNVDAYLENVLGDVLESTKVYDSPMTVLMLRSLENEIHGGVVKDTNTKLQELVTAYKIKLQEQGPLAQKPDAGDEDKDDEEKEDSDFSDEEDEDKDKPANTNQVEFDQLGSIARSMAILDFLKARESLQMKGDATSVKVLRDLAIARVSLSALSELLSVRDHSHRPGPDVCRQICSFMSPDSSDPDWCKRLHLFLFKCLDRFAGFQKAQEIVTNPWAVGNLPFVKQSPVFQEIDPPRSNVPQSDAFIILGDRYAEIRKLYRDALHDGNTSKALKLVEVKVEEKPHLLGAAVELGYFRNNEKQREVTDWLESRTMDKALKDKRWKKLFVNVACNKFKRKSLMRFSDDASLERALMVRVMFHLLGVTLLHPATQFHMIYQNPGRFKNGLLLSMPDDLMSALAFALGNAYVWMCPAGHPYMVGGAGECAWPMERRKCYVADCEEIVGGRSHAEEGGNKIQREYLADQNSKNFPGVKAVRAPKGYVLAGGIEEARNHGLNRPALSDVSCKMLRFCLHSLLFLNNSQDSGVDELLEGKDDFSEYLSEQCEAEFTVLQRTLDLNAEDTAFVLHKVIDNLDKNIGEQDFGHADQETRTTFETFFTNTCVNPVVNNVQDQVRGLKDQSVSARLRYLMNEVNESIDLNTPQGQHYREQNLPHLFLLRPDVNFQVFSNFFISTPEHQPRYQTLWHFISNIVQLLPLKYLPDIITWQRLVYSNYMRKLTPDDAKNKTVADVFEECKEHNWGDVSVWQQAWEGFRQAWNYLAMRMESQNDNFELRVECQPIILEKLSDDPSKVSLIFSLSTAENEGRMCEEVISYLVSSQNEFLKFLNQYEDTSEKPGEIEMKYGDQQQQESTGLEVPLEVATRAHVIILERRELDELVFSQSLEVAAYGKRQPVTYNFAALERLILDRFLHGKATLLKSDHYFEFAGEVKMATVVESLQREIEQETLDKDKFEDFDEEFDTHLERVKAFESLKECMLFLSRVGGAPDQHLYLFMRNVLGLERHACAPFKGRKGRRLMLKHVCSLFEQMNQSVVDNGPNRSRAPEVLDRYRADLPAVYKGEKGYLAKYMLGLKSNDRQILVTEWRNNLTDYGRIVEFQEDPPLENHLMGTIFPEDNMWILDFPKGLQVRHWATAFEVVAEVYYRNK